MFGSPIGRTSTRLDPEHTADFLRTKLLMGNHLPPSYKEAPQDYKAEWAVVPVFHTVNGVRESDSSTFAWVETYVGPPE